MIMHTLDESMKLVFLQQVWANSGPRAKCGPPQRFSGRRKHSGIRKYVQIWNFLRLITVNISVEANSTKACFLEGTPLRWMRPSQSGPRAKLFAQPVLQHNQGRTQEFFYFDDCTVPLPFYNCSVVPKLVSREVLLYDWQSEEQTQQYHFHYWILDWQTLSTS